MPNYFSAQSFFLEQILIYVIMISGLGIGSDPNKETENAQSHFYQCERKNGRGIDD